jgi:hypothetical protein
MSKAKRTNIEVQGTVIAVVTHGASDFISLTDIARYRNSQEPFAVINNWMRSRSTIEFLGLWEKLCNPIFKPLEFERFKNEAGSNYFVLSPQRWIESTQAIGITSKSGRYGGTFAHRDIAFEFASWISSEFKLYLIVEFQRLKDEENDRLQLGWNLQRTLAKINYRIHTDAIKETLIPPSITKAQATLVYANEADLLNVALFGQTAKQWRVRTPMPRATSATTPRWSSSSSSPTSKASTPCSSARACLNRNGYRSSMKSPSPKCAPCWQIPTSNGSDDEQPTSSHQTRPRPRHLRTQHV